MAHYLQCIRPNEPMDLGLVGHRLIHTAYKKAEEFRKDMDIIFVNCENYNGHGSSWTAAAKRLKEAFAREYRKAFLFGERGFRLKQLSGAR